MSNSLADLQQRFADSLRDPQASIDGEFNRDLRREKIYRELIFNNLDNLLAGTFPVLHATLENTLWKNLIRQFLREYRAQTPLFPQLPEEFLTFLQTAQLPESAPGWLTELAHYEWIELDLQLQEKASNDVQNNAIDQDCLRLSPSAIPLVYRYPVHRINPDFQPGETDCVTPTCLLVYRSQQPTDEQIQFMTVTPAAARLLTLVRDGITIEYLSSQLAAELQQPEPTTTKFVQEFLTTLSEAGIILGFRATP